MKVILINRKDGWGSRSFELALQSKGKTKGIGLRINFFWAGRNYNEDIATFDRAYFWNQKDGSLLIAIDSITEHIAGFDAPSTTMYAFKNHQLTMLKNAKRPTEAPDQIILEDKIRPPYPTDN